MRLDDLSETIDLAYAVAEGGADWDQLLRRVAEATHSRGSAYLHVDVASGALLDHREYGIPSEGWGDYSAHFVYIDPRVAHALERPRQALLTDYDFIDDRGMNRHAYYADFLSQYDFRYYAAVRLGIYPSTLGALNLQRSPREGHPDRAHGTFLLALKPHLERVQRLIDCALGRDLRIGAAQTALDRTRHAVLIVDGDRAIELANEAARALLSAGDGLVATDRRRRLAAAHRADRRRLAAAVADACAVSGGRNALAGSGVLALRRPRHAEPLVLQVLPIGRTVGSPLPGAGARPLAAILAARPEARARPPTDLLRVAFELTPQEARVVQRMARGEAPAAIAERLGITRETLRGYLKQIYAKTGTGRQAELVSKVLSLGLADEGSTLDGPVGGRPAQGGR